MADVISKVVLEELEERLTQVEAEKHALQQVLLAILAVMPAEQSGAARARIAELMHTLAIGGSAEALEHLGRQKATYENVFSALR